MVRSAHLISAELPWSHLCKFLGGLRLPKEEEPKVWVIFTHGYHSHSSNYSLFPLLCPPWWESWYDSRCDNEEDASSKYVTTSFSSFYLPAYPRLIISPLIPKLVLLSPHWLTQTPYPDTAHAYHPSVSLFSLMANTRLWPLLSPPPSPSSPLPYTHIKPTLS